MGILKAIATSVGITFCLFCLGCGVIAIPQGTPNISQILPQTIAAGSKSMSMKVVGSNFTSQAVILWNGNKLVTSVVDSNTLVGAVDSSSVAAPAVVQLQVKDPQTGKESHGRNMRKLGNASWYEAPPACADMICSTTWE